MKSNIKHFVIMSVILIMAISVGSAWAATVNPEDFESYTPDTGTNWTGSAVYSGGWIPTYNEYGWAASGSNYIWPDGGYLTGSPQVLRRNDTATSGDALFWDQNANITTLPMQIIEVKHRGLQQDSSGYGRVIIGTGANKVEYDNWTGGTGILNGTSLPNNNISWTFGSGYSYDWFVTQIEFDYTTNQMRARFGQVQGDLWNDWSSWVSMASTAQPSWVEIQLNGRIEIDDVVFTATPPEGWVIEEEDFESYEPNSTDNWTGTASWDSVNGWDPNYNVYGWAASGSNYIWPDGGYYSPQVIRRNDTANSGDVLFWDQSADIETYPVQTLSAQHRGLQLNTEGYGRVTVGIGNNHVEYTNSGTTGYLGSTPLPTNNVSWTFGSGYSTDWFETQIECDYTNNLVRARFGQVQGELWNDWTPWQAMADTTQPLWCKFIMDGKIEMDDFLFTGSPPSDGSGAWNVDASGCWQDNINWTARPNDNTHTATFGDVITADTVVYTEEDITIKGIVFNNINQYVIAGTGDINLEADSGNATIDIQAGSHQLQAEVVLLSETDVNIPAGTSLTFNNMLNLNGFDLNFTGTGSMLVSSILSTDGGDINNIDGGTLIVADKNGDGIVDLRELAVMAAYWLK